MSAEITAIVTGMIFGLTGGLTPGPLLTLVITESLKHGKKEGIKVALVPLITDMPVIVLSVILLQNLAGVDMLVGIIAIAGAIFLSYLGYESVVFSGVEIQANNVKPQSIKKGILANLLNPNPILFWITVGTPTLINAYEASMMAAGCFLFTMYFCLVGSKVVTAIIIGKSRSYFTSKYYIYSIRALGIILLIFAGMFFLNGLNAFGLFG